MAQLKCLVIADPSREAADAIAEATAELAVERVVVCDGESLLEIIRDKSPEAAVVSLELKRPDAHSVVKTLLRESSSTFVVATFRELSVNTMDQLGKLGVEDFIPQPIDYTQLFRAASARFGTPFRRHPRYEVSLEVFRADGVLIGNTSDVSAGGLRMFCTNPVHADTSLLVDIAIPNTETRLRVRFEVIAVEGQAPQTLTVRGEFTNLRGDEHKQLQAYLSSLP